MGTSYSDLTNEQLADQVRQNEMDMVTAKFSHSMNQLENTAQLKIARRKIAAAKTEIRRREIEQGLPKASVLNGIVAGNNVGADAAGDSGDDTSFLKGIVDKISGKE